MEAVQVANYFIRRSLEDKSPITNMKLLKLVYIGYGWVAATIERPLFADPIEAWEHGPVVPALYHEFKHYGMHDIDVYGISYNLDSGEMWQPQIPLNEKEILAVLDKVWAVYKRFSAWALRDKTHEDGTPWSTVFHSKCEPKVLEYDLIKDYFTGKIKEYLDYGSRQEAA